MAHYSLVNMGEVTIDRAQNTHMFCRRGKRNRSLVDVEGRDQFRIFNIQRLVFFKDKKLGFARRRLLETVSSACPILATMMPAPAML